MTDKLYPCTRCEGKGRISAFGHVLSGVCFKCSGSGKQKSKPTPKAIQWAVFGHDRTTDKPSRLYNVKAATESKAIAKAIQVYGNASASFKDVWTMSKAFALTWEELDAEERRKTDAITEYYTDRAESGQAALTSH